MEVVLISDLLRRVKKSVVLEDEIKYKRVTIKSKNAGIVLRDIEYGHSIGTKKQFIINKGQFLLSKIDARNGAFGIVNEELDDAIITGNFWAYEVNKEILNIEWFNIFVSSSEFISICDKASSGTTNRRYLDETKFLNYQINLPSLNEQDVFVERYKVLSSKLDLINNEINMQEKYLKKLKNSIFQDAVQGKLVPQDSNDEPAEVLLEKIREDKERLIKEKKIKKEKSLIEISEEEKNCYLPKGWMYSKLGSISIIGTGSTPLKSNMEYYENGDIPWITSSATGKDYIDNYEQCITSKALEECSLTINPAGTLIVAMYGQGKTRGQVSELSIDATTNQACASINLYNKDMKKYVKLFLKKIYLEIRELAAGGAQPNLNLIKIKNYAIPLPPLEEQKRIVEKVDSLMRLCDELEKRIEKQKDYSNRLMESIIKEI